MIRRTVRRVTALASAAACAAGLLAITDGGGAAAGAATAAGPSCGQPAGVHPWCDQSLSPDRRADLLTSVMTLPEKVNLVTGTFLCLGGGDGYTAGDPLRGIPALNLVGAGMGVSDVCGKELPITRPSGGKATELPAPIALAASFDPDLAYADGAVIGAETRDLGFNVSLAGDVNLARDPRNGRTFEAMGEDPVLGGTMTGAQLRGIQDQHVAATVKHFAMNNQEANRLTQSSNVDERTMRELELRAFEIAIADGQPASVMCSYNKVNGTPACANKHLLTDILKHDWNYPGWVMTDWWACELCNTVKAADAGLDQEQPNLSFYGPALALAVLTGQVPRKRLDDMVHRILRSMFATGLFDDPVHKHAIDVARGAALAQQVAEQSAVLLKNQRSVLPLNADALRSAAVIGAPANEAPPDPPPSAYVDSADPDTPLQGLRDTAPDVRFDYADGSDIAAAVAAAKSDDVAIVYATDTQGEGSDMANLSLDDHADALISAVAAANPRTIVVLMTGSAATMPWIDDVRGVLEAWYPGERGGHAIANLLFGKVNPSGRLPLTFPVHEADLPTAGSAASWPGTSSDIEYTEHLELGYRWYEAQGIRPLFPFGYGLSYGGAFRYSGLTVTPLTDTAPRRIRDSHPIARVDVTVTNVGSETAVEVPQLYVGLPARTHEPPKRLVGWSKRAIAPGQSATVSFTLRDRDLAYWSTASGRWRVAPGRYRLLVGSSSADIHARSNLHLHPARR